MDKSKKITVTLTTEDQLAFEAIKQHYGISSHAAAIRRVLREHAAMAKELATYKQSAKEQKVTYSRRVY